ncbi:MAG: hypothetical protein WC429_00125 [Verrucomicrobiia bacterium]|jgi:uncharacterized protein YcbK (DUF882 family)
MAHADVDYADFCYADIDTPAPPQRSPHRMKNYAVNKIAAFAKRVASLFTRFQTALAGAGYDATDIIASLNTRANALPATDETQEHAKAVQAQQTAATTAAAQAAYTNASKALDTAIGFLGKDTPEADEGRRLRGGVQNKKSASQVAVFLRDIVAYLGNHSVALNAKKFDPTAKIAELTALATPLEEAKGLQEQKKNERGDSTSAVIEAKDTLFADANKALEGAIGLFQSNSEFVAEARRIRTEFYGPDTPPEQPPAPPAQPNPPTP